MDKKTWIAAAMIVLIGIAMLIIIFFRQETDQPVPAGKPEGVNANYDMAVRMEENGNFHISAVIKITNNSADKWDEIGFYLVPNAMNAIETEFYRDDHAAVEISALQVDGRTADYSLDNNALFVQLDEVMEPGAASEVAIDYRLELPIDGMRLARVEDNYYLAHWYPMLGIYDQGWDIRNYDPKGESYDTGYGNFNVSFQLPKEYLIASSADDGLVEAVSAGELEGENYKDFYIAFMDPDGWETRTVQVNDTQLRVFAPAGAEAGLLDDTTELAAEAYGYFEQEIGDNPFKELDVIANDGYMEYPNIIEVATEAEALESILVHEIAHQWFYFLVANDPYNEAWLDESLTEFTTALFISDRNGDAESGFQDASLNLAAYPPQTYLNLPLNKFKEAEYYSTVYGKGPLLFKEYFAGRGRREAAWEFLSAYYAECQFKQVDTEDFKKFFEDYFEGDQSDFLDSWLK